MAGMVPTQATTGTLGMGAPLAQKTLTMMTQAAVEAAAQMAGTAPTLATHGTTVMAMITHTLSMAVIIHHPLHARQISNARTCAIL